MTDWVQERGQRVRVVKEVDSKSTGLCPREFKSRRCRMFFAFPVQKLDRDCVTPKGDAVCGDRTHALTNTRLKRAP
jgi:hypothetical protein